METFIIVRGVMMYILTNYQHDGKDELNDAVVDYIGVNWTQTPPVSDIGQVSAYTCKLYELPPRTSKGLLHFVQKEVQKS